MFFLFPCHKHLCILSVRTYDTCTYEEDYRLALTVSLCLFFSQVFLSIKGIYYQIELQGQTITWIVPYVFNYTVSTVCRLEKHHQSVSSSGTHY